MLPESRILIKIWQNLLNLESGLRMADPSIVTLADYFCRLPPLTMVFSISVPSRSSDCSAIFKDVGGNVGVTQVYQSNISGILYTYVLLSKLLSAKIIIIVNDNRKTATPTSVTSAHAYT